MRRSAAHWMAWGHRRWRVMVLVMPALASARRLTEDYAGVLVTRLILLVVAAACLVVMIVGKVTPGQTHKLPAMTVMAFVAVLVLEICGRFLFYASRVTVGI